MKLARSAIQAMVGLGIGGVSLGFAVRGVPLRSVVHLARIIDYDWVALALALYSCDLGLRMVRWRMLLQRVAPLSLGQVSEALVVGYAFNNLLPARLGEFMRADYLRARSGVDRSSILGTIVVERLVDGLSVVGILYAGMLLITRDQSIHNLRAASTISAITASGAGIMFLALMLVVVAGFLGQRILPFLHRSLREPARRVMLGMRGVDPPILGQLFAINLLIWSLELSIFWASLRAANVTLESPQVLVLTGAASLSTLVPTAPGFLGTYQYAFALCMDLFGLPRAPGILAATVVQVFLLSTATIIGVAIYAIHHVRHLAVSVSRRVPRQVALGDATAQETVQRRA